MAKRETKRDHDREIKNLLNLLDIQGPRYMIVDATTNEDIREACDSEVEHIRRSTNFAGVAALRLGGGWKNPDHLHAVTLRRMGVSPPDSSTSPEVL